MHPGRLTRPLRHMPSGLSSVELRMEAAIPEIGASRRALSPSC